MRALAAKNSEIRLESSPRLAVADGARASRFGMRRGAGFCSAAAIKAGCRCPRTPSPNAHNRGGEAVKMTRTRTVFPPPHARHVRAARSRARGGSTEDFQKGAAKAETRRLRLRDTETFFKQRHAAFNRAAKLDEILDEGIPRALANVSAVEIAERTTVCERTVYGVQAGEHSLSLRRALEIACEVPQLRMLLARLILLGPESPERAALPPELQAYLERMG